jgi:thymidine phosphorylase
VSAAAGVEMLAKPGDRVTAGAPLLRLHTDDPDRFARALSAVDGAIDVGPAAADPTVPADRRTDQEISSLVLDRIGES